MTTRRRAPAEVVIAEGLTIGPDDVLILRLPDVNDPDQMIENVQEALKHLGVWERTFIVQGDVEIAKMQR